MAGGVNAGVPTGLVTKKQVKWSRPGGVVVGGRLAGVKLFHDGTHNVATASSCDPADLA